ncbi:MAG: LysR family transcriptional regulator [Betaproteobacteria bacterium]|nr:LysR family transcriptional regulator [Betaproteobacteria bacterium]
MDLRALKCFVWVADLGSITRAATELGIVQPALSRHIQRVEGELGTPLFTRLPRGVQLTPAGRQFLEHARRILREVERAKSELKVRPAAVKGRVALGLSPTIAPVIAPGCLERARRYLPDVILRVVEGFSPILQDHLIAGQLDLALLTNPSASAMLRFVPLVSEPIVVVSPPGARRFYTLDDLCREPVTVTSGIRAMVEDQIRKHGRRLEIAVEIDSIEAIRRLLLRESAITLVPVSAFRDELDAGHLDALPIVDANVHRLLVLATRAAGKPPAALDQVAEIVTQEVNALSEQGAFSLAPEWGSTRKDGGRSLPRRGTKRPA